MRRSAAFLAVVVLLVACSPEERQQLDAAAARLNEEALFAFADKYLSDEDLSAAAPEGFTPTGIKRNGFDRHGGNWVTVGIQMEGPVLKPRAIFYIHRDTRAAEEMFRRQVQINEQEVVIERPVADGDPWSLRELDVDNRCSPRLDQLFWCHAYRGNVYLVTQSSAGWPRGMPSAKELRAAKRLLRAFGTYLQEQIPQE